MAASAGGAGSCPKIELGNAEETQTRSISEAEPAIYSLALRGSVGDQLALSKRPSEARPPMGPYETQNRHRATGLHGMGRVFGGVRIGANDFQPTIFDI